MRKWLAGVVAAVLLSTAGTAVADQKIDFDQGVDAKAVIESINEAVGAQPTDGGFKFTGRREILVGTWSQPKIFISMLQKKKLPVIDPGGDYTIPVRCPAQQGYYEVCLYIDVNPASTHLHRGDSPQATVHSQVCQQAHVSQGLSWRVSFPNIAAEVTVTFVVSGACQSPPPDKYNMAVPEVIDELGPGEAEDSGYVLDPIKTEHTSGFFARSEGVAKFKRIAREYQSAFPSNPPLKVRGMSLEWGGRYDLNGDWNPPFAKHDRGWQLAIAILPFDESEWLKWRLAEDEYGGNLVEYVKYQDIDFDKNIRRVRSLHSRTLDKPGPH